MDIALLKIDADEKLAYTTFGNSDSIKWGMGFGSWKPVTLPQQ
jgi:S1-C subfamily serine protease